MGKSVLQRQNGRKMPAISAAISVHYAMAVIQNVQNNAENSRLGMRWTCHAMPVGTNSGA